VDEGMIWRMGPIILNRDYKIFGAVATEPVRKIN